VTSHFPPPVADATAIPTLLVEAARCWRDARDTGRSVQPCLSTTLAAQDCAMLAPVFDSLCLFYEAALGRPMTIGAALELSDDEHLLLPLLDGSTPRQCLNCSSGKATALNCALCSTRIMLALTTGYPDGRTLQ
jgi:hypothetical protein